MSLAYYNEHEPYAAEWLRNLIAAGHIAPGVVDERDMRDIRPEELFGFTQVHLFSGIGIWSLALRQAGWSDDRPIWTGSCPCQPFSAAGKGGGFDDERHLWPAWHWLIEQCRPDLVIGEQVSSKDGLGWYDLVSADLEGTGYAVGAVDLCAAGIGVEWQDSQGGEWLRRAIHDCTDPRIAMALGDFADWAGAGNIGDGGKHIRQRLYFVGMADSAYLGIDRRGERGTLGRTEYSDGGEFERLADPMHAGRAERRAVAGNGQIAGLRATSRLENPQLPPEPRQRPVSGTDISEQTPTGLAGGCLADGLDVSRRSDSGMLRGEGSSRMVDTDRSGTRAQSGDYCEAGEETTRGARADDGSALSQRTGGIGGLADGSRTDASDSRRDAVDWLFCRDDRWRAVSAGTFPLAHGVTARVGKLRAFGNALDAKTATHFCEVVKEIVG